MADHKETTPTTGSAPVAAADAADNSGALVTANEEHKHTVIQDPPRAMCLSPKATTTTTTLIKMRIC